MYIDMKEINGVIPQWSKNVPYEHQRLRNKVFSTGVGYFF